MTEATACRRCTECKGRIHHWIESMAGFDFAEIEKLPTHACKHCGAIGAECESCDGEGCLACHNEGVTDVTEKEVRCYVISKPDTGTNQWIFAGDSIDLIIDCVRSQLRDEMGEGNFSEIHLKPMTFTMKQLSEMPEFEGW